MSVPNGASTATGQSPVAINVPHADWFVADWGRATLFWMDLHQDEASRREATESLG